MLAHLSIDRQPVCQGDLNVEYRQLVSRASTQRLHSPSLSNTRKLLASDPLAQWELDERRMSKARMEERIRFLGINWGT